MAPLAVTKEPPHWGGARVLLAEDDADTRLALTSVLRREGHRVIVAKDGRELLDLIAVDLLLPREPPAFDLIVSDVRMPGVTGLEILEGLHAAGSATPFIVITAYGTPELHEAVKREGASCCLDKPFELGQFRAAVARALAPLWEEDQERDQREAC